MRYGADRLRSLVLVDMTPFPFSGGAWNSHRLRDANYEGMHANLASLWTDRPAFARRFVDSMFAPGAPPGDDRSWMVTESMKTPTAVAAAIYSDYVMRDYTDALGTISIPTTVFGADSGIFERGLEQGRWVAARIPGATFVGSDGGGHALFREEAAAFNGAVARAARPRLRRSGSPRRVRPE